MNQLTLLEQVFLDKLLAGPGSVLAGLRTQLRSLVVKERSYTGVGCHTSFDLRGAPGVGSCSFRLGDVLAELRGVEGGVGAVLFVRDGRMERMEMYTFGGEPWPQAEDILDVSYVRIPRELPPEVSEDGCRTVAS